MRLFESLLAALAASFLLSSCATRAVETEAALAHRPANLPGSFTIEDVPFIKQQTNYCGPATLAMSLAYSGRLVKVEELAREVYTPGANGSYQSDMISAARRNGMLAVPIHGLPALMTEIANKHPVIIFENLALPWYPIYHYALVYGYSLDDESVTLHSGPVAAKNWDLRKFERSWMLGDYWGLVVLPPGEIASSADDLAHATAASALEQAGFPTQARIVYSSILAQWPESLSGLIGLANLDYANGDSARAARWLSRAVAAHPENASAWHNLAIAQADAGLKREARLSARQALAHASSTERAVFTESLKDLTTTL